MLVCGLDSCGSGKVPTVDTTEHDNELSGAIKFREIFDLLSSYQLHADIQTAYLESSF